eukprot:4292767-Alexandrium_andersonii.AAC.1
MAEGAQGYEDVMGPWGAQPQRQLYRTPPWAPAKGAASQWPKGRTREHRERAALPSVEERWQCQQCG